MVFSHKFLVVKSLLSAMLVLVCSFQVDHYQAVLCSFVVGNDTLTTWVNYLIDSNYPPQCSFQKLSGAASNLK